MSYNKFQSKLFPPDFSQIPQRLKTHTPKNEPDYMISSKRYNTNRVNTIQDVYHNPSDMEDVNRSVNDRLEYLLKIQSPIPSVPQTVRNRVDSSRLFHSNSRVDSVQTSEFHLQQSKRLDGNIRPTKYHTQSYDTDQLYQTNVMLQNKVEELKGIIFQLTNNQQAKDSLKYKSGIGMENKRLSEGISRLEYSTNNNNTNNEDKYKALYHNQKTKTLQLQKQKHGLEVLLKLVKQELHDTKQSMYSSDNHEVNTFNKQLQDEINELELQNAQLSDSLVMAESELKLYLNRTKQLQLQLDNVTKECKKYQKHNSLMLHSSQIIQNNFDQTRKRSKINQSLKQQSIEHDKDLLISRKDDQINLLMGRVNELQNKLRNQSNTSSKIPKDYDNKIKQFSSKLLSFESENMKSMTERQEQFNRQLSSITFSHQSEIQHIENKFNQDRVKYLKQIDKFKNTSIEAQIRLKEKEIEYINLQKKLDHLNKQYQQNLTIIKNNQIITKQLEKKLQEAETRRLDVEKDLAHKSKSFTDSKEENDRLWKQCQMLNKSIISLKVAIEELEGQKTEFEKEKLVIQGERSNMIKEIIHLKEEVSLWKITQLQARNKLTEINIKLQQVQSKHIKANNKLNIISDKLKGLTEKYGYITQPSPPNSPTALQPDHRLQLLEWLQGYIDQIKQNQERSFIERQEQQKQYIAQINSKFNEMAMENARLKDIVAQNQANSNDRYEEDIIQRLKDSLNSTNNKSEPHNLETIKQESMIRDLEIERLELIRKRLLELQRIQDNDGSKGEKEYNFREEEAIEDEWSIDRLMDDIEKSLQRIKKNIISRQAHYSTIRKNNELQVKQLRQQNHKMKDIQSKVELMTTKLLQQDQRIKEFQSTKRNSIQNNIPTDKDQYTMKRRQSWNFKQQSVTTFQNLESNSQSKIVFNKEVENFLNQNLSKKEENLHGIMQELMAGLQQYSNHKELFEMFEKFIRGIKSHEDLVEAKTVTMKQIIEEYFRNLEDVGLDEDEIELIGDKEGLRMSDI